MLSKVDSSTIRDKDIAQYCSHLAKEKAYHRHSNFSVGAALLCTDGQVITGCSVDNAAYG